MKMSIIYTVIVNRLSIFMIEMSNSKTNVVLCEVGFILGLSLYV